MKKYALICAAVLSLALFMACASAAQPAPASIGAGFTPCGRAGCFWCTPMDIADEAAVWEMLTAPVTVLAGYQKDQYLLRAQPDENAEAVGEITYDSQGVHVLAQTADGWTYIEAYSSSFHGSKTETWNAFVRGYVPTALLESVQPSQYMGMVIDKLTQRLYLFMDGALYTTLRVSTGLANEAQPYNETQAGEYLIVSPVGQFKSDNLVCEMGMRFNAGNLLHQVPYRLTSRGTKDYDTYEKLLGQRASHGCVRVQRKRTPEGVNMRWLWSNRDMNTKLVIWDDLPGRAMAVPAADTPVFYNPQGGKTYHKLATCYGVRDEYLPLAPLTYAQLFDAAYDELTDCPYCNPPVKMEEAAR